MVEYKGKWVKNQGVGEEERNTCRQGGIVFFLTGYVYNECMSGK
jgi:hypothetical protein